MAFSRRDFLTGMGCAFLTRAALYIGAERLLTMNAFAGTAADAPSTYRALVCIFLFGGNDANNVVIPYDDYASYDAARAGSPFHIAQADLLQISAPSQGATFGLPNRGTYNTTAIQDLYNRGKLAFVVNMGTLDVPLDRATYLSRPDLRPDQLFSHSNQQSENQTAVAR